MTKDEQSFPLKKPDNEHNPQNLFKEFIEWGYKTTGTDGESKCFQKRRPP